jgi:hypothetical protein
MKYYKHFIIAVILVLLSYFSMKPANAQLTEGQAAVIGGVIGYVIGKDKRENVYVQPPYSIYGNPYVAQPPVVIHPSQLQGYSSETHGYCAVYTNEMYYQCLGNIQRQKNEAAYLRGLYGR